jgi:hypothetical protein
LEGEHLARARQLLNESGQTQARLLCLVEVVDKDRNVGLEMQKEVIGVLNVTPSKLLGIFVSPLTVECSLHPAPNSIKDSKSRLVLREVKDFCVLLAKNHPALLEMLFETPLFSSEDWEKLLNLRKSFLTKQTARSVHLSQLSSNAIRSWAT